MSIAGILSSALFSSGASSQSAQSKSKDFKQEFQQLGQDLQSGNLTAAKADVTALQQLAPPSSTTSQSTSPIAQAFSQLSQDLKAGNTTAAQSDFRNYSTGHSRPKRRNRKGITIIIMAAEETTSVSCWIS